MFAECACGFMHVSNFLNVELRYGFKKKLRKWEPLLFLGGKKNNK